MKTATIRVPQPCHERWDAMTPSGTGRHCAACQQVVVDFTHKTDGEILAYLARAGTATCGRFRADQLARPLQPAAPTSRWRSWLASVLALGGVLGSGRAASQGLGNYFSAGPVPAVAGPASGAAPAPVPASAAVPAASGAGGPALVHGVVLDSASGDRLPGVTILLKGTTRGTSTDANGEFVLELPEAASATLLVSSVGYVRQEIAAANVVATVPVSIRLAADTHVLGNEVVIYAGGISMYSTRKPWPWHPRRLYQWGKYQLLRPFRQ